jgi:hypothetical protein
MEDQLLQKIKVTDLHGVATKVKAIFEVQNIE